jgi:hypothetical protein
VSGQAGGTSGGAGRAAAPYARGSARLRYRLAMTNNQISHPLSIGTRIWRGAIASLGLVVSAATLIAAGAIGTDPNYAVQADDLREMVTVLFTLTLFTVVVANWLQLGAIVMFTVVSVVLIGPFDIDPTTVSLINLALTAIVTFAGAGTRTIFK